MVAMELIIWRTTQAIIILSLLRYTGRAEKKKRKTIVVDSSLLF